MMIFKNHNRLGFFGHIEDVKLDSFENDEDIKDFITASKRATDWRNAFCLYVECQNSSVINYLVNNLYKYVGLDFMSSVEVHNNPYKCVVTLNYCTEYRDYLRCLSSEVQEVIKCRCLYTTTAYPFGECFTRVSERFLDGGYYIDDHIEVFKFDLSEYPDIGYIKKDLVEDIFERTGKTVEGALYKSLITDIEERWKIMKSSDADSGSNIYHITLSVTSRHFSKQLKVASGMLIL